MRWLRTFLNKRKYSKIAGITPQPSDKRDHRYKPTIDKALPEVDLRSNFPYVKDQRSTNACTGFAVTALFEHEIKEKLGLKRKFSPLFCWYNARKLEGKQGKNEGVFLRNMFKAVLDKGFTYESLMPFKPNYLRAPTKEAYNIGSLFKEMILEHKCTYERVLKSEMDKCLSEGNPIVFGICVNNSFYNNKDGFIESTTPTGGGHAMTLAGYKMLKGKKHYIVKNSWDYRGDKGYLYIEATHLKKYGFDYWTVQLEE